MPEGSHESDSHAVLIGFGFPRNFQLKGDDCRQAHPACIPGVYTDLTVIFSSLVGQDFTPHHIHIITDEPPRSDWVDSIFRRPGKQPNCKRLQDMWARHLKAHHYQGANIHYVRSINQCPPGTYESSEGHSSAVDDRNGGVAMVWDVLFDETLREGNFLAVHISSHGSRLRDSSQDEFDNMDEIVIVPSDRRIDLSYLLDDEIYTWLTTLPPTLNVLFTVDACHGGGMADLPYRYMPVGKPERIADLSDELRFWCLDQKGLPRVDAGTYLPSANIFFIASAGSTHSANNETLGVDGQSFSQTIFRAWLSQDHFGLSLHERTNLLLAVFDKVEATQWPFIAAFPTIQDKRTFHMFTAEKGHAKRSSGGMMPERERAAVLAPKDCYGSWGYAGDFIVKEEWWAAEPEPKFQGWVIGDQQRYVPALPSAQRAPRKLWQEGIGPWMCCDAPRSCVPYTVPSRDFVPHMSAPC